MPSYNDSRNTPIWAFDRLRSDAIPKLLDDMAAAEASGFPEATCQEIHSNLGALTNLATEIPDKSIFRKSLWEHFEQLQKEYKLWNDISGNDADSVSRRKEQLKKVRRLRNKIATITRENRHILSRELDLKAIDSVYKGFNKLASGSPSLLRNLFAAISRYFSRRKD